MECARDLTEMNRREWVPLLILTESVQGESWSIRVGLWIGLKKNLTFSMVIYSFSDEVSPRERPEWSLRDDAFLDSGPAAGNFPHFLEAQKHRTWRGFIAGTNRHYQLIRECRSIVSEVGSEAIGGLGWGGEAGTWRQTDLRDQTLSKAVPGPGI